MDPIQLAQTNRNVTDRNGLHLRTGMILLASVVMIACMGSAFMRNAVWIDDTALLLDTVTKSPGKARVHISLGMVYARMNRPDLAIKSYENGLRIDPGNAAAYSNLGILYKQLGFIDKAIVLYERALDLQGDIAQTYNNLGNAYYQKGNIEQAVGFYREALRVTPTYLEARFNLILTYIETGRPELAAPEIERILSTDPENERALTLRAQVARTLDGK